MMSVFSQINQFRQFLPHTVEVLLSSNPFLCHPRFQTGIDLAVDAQIGIPNSVLFLILVQMELLQIVFPTIFRQMGDHTDFVQVGRLGLQCWTKMLAICVVVDGSKCLDILPEEVSIMLQRSSF